MKYSIIIFLSCCALLSCYKDKEGCLDRLATNYDVAADVECENCCEYPSLKLQFSHQMNNVAMALNKELKNDISSSYALISQQFYISSIAIEPAGNQKLDFINKGIYLLQGNKQIEYIKDYVLVSGLSTSAEVNKFKSNQPITKMNFTLGLDDKFNAIDVPKATNYFELDEISGMYDANSKTYLSYTAKLAVGQNLKDTITINLRPDLNQNLTITGVQSKYGEAIEIKMSLLYDKLFSGVNFSDDKANIENKMNSNFGSFIKK